MFEWSAASVVTAIAAVVVASITYSLLGPLSYWKRRGIPHSKDVVPFLGHFGPVLMKKVSFFKLFGPMTEPFRQVGYCGFYQWHMPILVVWDPDMAKQILTKDFSSFHDRGQPFDEENDPLSSHLFNLEGPRWRNLRNKLSPTFTSGKLKLMLPLMRDVSDAMGDALLKDAQENGGEANIKDLLTRFSTDVIGTCAFGIQCNSLVNKNNEFLKMSRQVFSTNFWALLRFFLNSIHPKLAALVPFKFVFTEVNRFFLDLMKNTVEYRKKNKVERNDFVNLMIQLQEADRTQDDRENHIEFNDGVMTAQAFIFFLAGLDNISNVVGFCLYKLADDVDLQRRAAEEVRAAIKEEGGQLTYEALKKMDLLGRIINEGLRLWSPIGFLVRKCNATTVIGNITVEQGQMVMIAGDLIHKSKELYPDPLKFDPDRFTQEAKEARHQYSFLPFGEGPRICIAERFALLEMKLALASLLNGFEFTPGPRTEKEPELDQSSFVPQPKNGFWLKIEKRV